MEDINRLKSAQRHLQGGRVEEALREYIELAEQGSAEAAYRLGVIYQTGRCVSKDITRAKDYFVLGRERGNALSTYFLAGIYWHEFKIEKALALYKSIASENPSAAFWAFRCLRKLAKGQKDLEEEAERYLIQAKTLGHIEALWFLSIKTAMGKYGLRSIPSGISQFFSVVGAAKRSMRNREWMKYRDSLHRIGFKLYSKRVARGKT